MKVKCCCKWWVVGIPPTWLVLCGVILVQVGFGLYPVVVRKFASTAEPLIIAFYQDVGCCPLLFICALIVERKLIFPGIKMLLVFMLLGLTGQFASHLLYILGVYWAGPNPANAIQPIIPVWTTILAIVTCTEKFPSPLHVHSWIKLLSIIMAVGGAIELILTANHDDCADKNSGNCSSHEVLQGNSSFSHSLSLTLVGYLALFVDTISIAVYILLQKRLIFNSATNKWRNYPIYVTAYSYMFGALYMGLSSIYYLATKQQDKYILEGTSVYAVVYAIFITSATCSLLLTWTNMHLSPIIMTAFWPLQVLVSVVVSYFVTHDQLAPYQYIGAVMLILALFMVLFSNYMEERLQEGKSVLRVDCHMTKPATKHEEIGDKDEKSPLLSNLPITEPQQVVLN